MEDAALTDLVHKNYILSEIAKRGARSELLQMEERFPRTASHTLRVSLYAGEIAEAYAKGNWKDQNPMTYNHFRTKLEIAGALHDIGKIYIDVPVDVIEGYDAPSEEEYGLLREHVKRGVEKLDELGVPGFISDIVRKHHVYMDGSGYPEETATVESQILAIADVYDRLTSPESYKKGDSHALRPLDAVAHLRNEKERWDSQVVDALEAVLKASFKVVGGIARDYKAPLAKGA